MADRYRLISTRFRGMTQNAVFVDKPLVRGRGECTIPKSLIYGPDEIKLAGVFAGDEITIRIMGWKAEELGFA